jgi:hypothetical protein
MASRIYSEFSSEIVWIRRRVLQHSLTLPQIFDRSARYYLNQRLKILSNPEWKYPPVAQFLPYAVFWLSRAFDCPKPRSVRKIALSLVYDIVSVTLVDDASDSGLEKWKNELLLSLAENYSSARLQLQSEVFPPRSSFWPILSDSRASFSRYLEWNSTYHASVDPLSDAFLEESSRYTVSLCLPAFAGVAILARRKAKIAEISRFLRSFFMGWRIADDIWDWKDDVRMPNLNNSTVLLLIKRRFATERVTREMVLSMFLDDDFVRLIYARIFQLLERARNDARRLDCPYLDEFMDSWIGYNTKKRDSLVESGELFQSRLRGLLLHG